MTTESELIERIRRAVPSRGRGDELRLGIGDDAAVFSPPRGRVESVVTCDALLENVHFLAQAHPPDAVGYKALARATSDLAAMGAAPRFFLLGLALPSQRTGRWLNAFLAGMARAARKFGLVLAGGDTARHSTVAVNVTVIGEVAAGRAITRAGAHPGDWLFASGRLGAAQLGLELILRGLYRQRRWKRLLAPHFYPALRLALGEWLARRQLASAMIDLSDGLSTDLAHLCESSSVGARVWRERLPAARVPPGLRARGLDALGLALHGGEDYELLFTVPRSRVRKIPSSYRGAPLTAIGEITREKQIRLIGADGRAQPLASRGWDHFRSARPHG